MKSFFSSSTILKCFLKIREQVDSMITMRIGTNMHRDSEGLQIYILNPYMHRYDENVERGQLRVRVE